MSQVVINHSLRPYIGHLPPHCPNWVWTGPAGATLVEVGGADDGGTEDGALVGALLEALELPGGAAAPEPIAVVIGPSSMYTPEK